MATKKKQAQPVTHDLFVGLTEDERKQVIAKFQRMALNLRTMAQDFTALVEYLDKPKNVPIKDRKDDNSEPSFRYLTRVPIPKDIYLTRRIQEYARDMGFNSAEIPEVFTAFKDYYERTQTKWQDWSLVAMKWYRTDMQRRKQQKYQNENAPRTSRTLQEFK